jgi:hypothetical protein
MNGSSHPHTPKNDNHRRPRRGASPRRIKTVEIISYRFSWLGCEPDRLMLVFKEQKNYVTLIGSLSGGITSGGSAYAWSGVKTSMLMLPIFPSRRT